MEEDLVSITTVPGIIEAEIVRGLLQSYGIPSLLLREAASSAYAVGVGPLGEVQIMVRAEHAAQASEIVERYDAGRRGSG